MFMCFYYILSRFKGAWPRKYVNFISKYGLIMECHSMLQLCLDSERGYEIIIRYREDLWLFIAGWAFYCCYYPSPTHSVWEEYCSRRVSQLVSDAFIHFNGFLFRSYDGKVDECKAYVPIHVYLCFCVCETLVFWRWNDVKTFGARFLQPFCCFASHVYCFHNMWLTIAC